MTPTLTARLLIGMLGLVTFSVSTSHAQESERIVGYFVSWGVYARDYHVPDVPADKLTHLNFGFANISGGECVVGDPWADTQLPYPGDVYGQPLSGSFHQLQLLKAAHPHLKTMISVGGWTWSSAFSAVAATPTSRATFAASCVDFVVTYGFDGVDLDWEYPVSGGLVSGSPADSANFTLLLAELRAQLDAREVIDSREYLLSIAAAAGPGTIPNYQLDQIHPYLDWINLMSFDFFGGWSPVTGFLTPLYDSTETPAGFENWNTDSAVNSYLAAGVPPEKIQIAASFYGRGFAGVANVNNGLSQPFSGLPSGTWEAGVFDYSDIIANYVTPSTRHWHDVAQAPWHYDPATGVMISYDDAESIMAKAQYVLDRGLGGMMFWELSGDDDANTLLDAIDDTFAGTITEFIRGDANGDGVTNLADPIAILGVLFGGGTAALDCDDASDLNDDGQLDISDPIFQLGALFVPGASPVPLPISCGPDPTADSLDCGDAPGCP